MSERAAGDVAPIAAAPDAMIHYDGVTRTEPAMMPPLLIDPWDPEDPFMSGTWRSVE